MAVDNIDGETLNHLLIDNAAQLLFEKRQQNVQLFRSELDEIIHKYSQNFDEVGDEIDIMTGEIVVDRGHLRGMQTELDPGKRHDQEPTDGSVDILPSVEQPASVDNDGSGWESEDSVDELAAEYFTEPARPPASSPAQSNKENQRPVLVDVTATSVSNAPSTNAPSPSPPNMDSFISQTTSGPNLNSQTISDIHEFLAMAKRLEPLLQGVVQPGFAGQINRVAIPAHGIDFPERPQPRKRPRINDYDMTESSSSHFSEPSQPSETFSVGSLNALQGPDSDMSERRKRANDPNASSIWEPNVSDNMYYDPKAKSNREKGPRRPYKKRKLVPASISGLRNELLSDIVDSLERARGAERANAGLPGDHSSDTQESFQLPNNKTRLNKAGHADVNRKRVGRPAVYFSVEEDALLLKLIAEGHPWTHITPHFPGRTYGQLYYHHKKHLCPLLTQCDQPSSEDDTGFPEADTDMVTLLPVGGFEYEDDYFSPPRSLPVQRQRIHTLEPQSLSSPAIPANLKARRGVAMKDIDQPHINGLNEQNSISEILPELLYTSVNGLSATSIRQLVKPSPATHKSSNITASTTSPIQLSTAIEEASPGEVILLDRVRTALTTATPPSKTATDRIITPSLRVSLDLNTESPVQLPVQSPTQEIMPTSALETFTSPSRPSRVNQRRPIRLSLSKNPISAGEGEAKEAERTPTIPDRATANNRLTTQSSAENLNKPVIKSSPTQRVSIRSSLIAEPKKTPVTLRAVRAGPPFSPVPTSSPLGKSVLNRKTAAASSTSNPPKRTPIIHPPSARKGASTTPSVAKNPTLSKRSSSMKISQFLMGGDDDDTTEDEDVILISSTPSRTKFPKSSITKFKS
jgi:hypothetical protein